VLFLFYQILAFLKAGREMRPAFMLRGVQLASTGSCGDEDLVIVQLSNHLLTAGWAVQPDAEAADGATDPLADSEQRHYDDDREEKLDAGLNDELRVHGTSWWAAN
jgi:hypothetical protein